MKFSKKIFFLLLTFLIIVNNRVFSTPILSVIRAPLIGSHGHGKWIKDYAMYQLGNTNELLSRNFTLKGLHLNMCTIQIKLVSPHKFCHLISIYLQPLEFECFFSNRISFTQTEQRSIFYAFASYLHLKNSSF